MQRVVICVASIIASALAILFSGPASADSIQLYFSQNGAGGPLSNIRRIPALGGTSEIFHTGLYGPFGVDVDLTGRKVYWSDSGANIIYRKGLDGSGVAEELISSGLNGPAGIALDVQRGKMYFADRANSAIKRANLDGSNPEVLVNIFGSLPDNIAVDPIGKKVYWGEMAFGRVNRANLDGTDVETIISGIGSISGIVIDRSQLKLYFANRTDQKIQRSNLDGSAIEDVITDLAKPPLAIELDVEAGKVYWSFFDSIQSANLDLSGDIETLVSGLAGSELLNGVNGLALDLSPPQLTDCSDDADNDGDTLIDYPDDPGCRNADSSIENPKCQDGLDNDGDGRIDFDGGISALGYPATDSDPQCVNSYRNREGPYPCGLGIELALLLPPVIWLSCRQRQRSEWLRASQPRDSSPNNSGGV